MNKIEVESSKSGIHGVTRTVTAELENREQRRAKKEVATVEVAPVAKVVPLTANHQRAGLIQRAKEFVEEHQRDLPGDTECRDYGNNVCRSKCYDTEFFVKDNKVTAVVQVIFMGSRKPNPHFDRLVGRAICSTGDVFNEWIGKAIALAKALGIDIPQEFLDAVQPDTLAVGQNIKGTSRGTGTLTSIEEGRGYIDGDTSCFWSVAEGVIPSNATIFDDTNAEYEVN